MFNNASTGSGGGVYASSSVLSLNEAVFTKNHGVWGGGRSLQNSYKCDAFEGLGGLRAFSLKLNEFSFFSNQYNMASIIEVVMEMEVLQRSSSC